MYVLGPEPRLGDDGLESERDVLESSDAIGGAEKNLRTLGCDFLTASSCNCFFDFCASISSWTRSLTIGSSGAGGGGIMITSESSVGAGGRSADSLTGGGATDTRLTIFLISLFDQKDKQSMGGTSAATNLCFFLIRISGTGMDSSPSPASIGGRSTGPFESTVGAFWATDFRLFFAGVGSPEDSTTASSGVTWIASSRIASDFRFALLGGRGFDCLLFDFWETLSVMGKG